MKNKERLYLITDSSSIESLIEKSFRTYGFIVRTDSDTGQFSDNIIEFGPDVIVIDSDINQFNIDDICNSIENCEKLSDIPVIMMTHIEDEEIILTALSRCIYDYVYKPVEPNILHSRIRVILSMKAKFR
ncbi:MAG: response regulator, partial [candidate division WOR-3 bacterium]|nr:response regulator [candidate division WOR-3 bacterium]